MPSLTRTLRKLPGKGKRPVAVPIPQSLYVVVVNRHVIRPTTIRIDNRLAAIRVQVDVRTGLYSYGNERASGGGR